MHSKVEDLYTPAGQSLRRSHYHTCGSVFDLVETLDPPGARLLRCFDVAEACRVHSSPVACTILAAEALIVAEAC